MIDLMSIFSPDQTGKFPDEAEKQARLAALIREADADLEAEFGMVPGGDDLAEVSDETRSLFDSFHDELDRLP